MTDDYGVDLEEILRVIDRAAVLIVRFDVLEPRLLVDFRADPPDMPIHPACGPGQFRGGALPTLEVVASEAAAAGTDHVVPWPRAVRAFEESGIWEKIEERLISLGSDPDHIKRIQQQLLDGEPP